MDPEESTISASMSDSTPISPSPVTMIAATEEIKDRDTLVQEEPNQEGDTLVKDETKEADTLAQEEAKGGDAAVKKKRGRPRKYDDQGKLINPSETPGESSAKKRSRKGKEKVEAGPSRSLGGENFRTFAFVVNPQEDIIEKIMSFTQQESRGVCVLSVNGTVANVSIQPVSVNRNVLTYTGLCEIISLNGTMMVSESGGIRNVRGLWRITLAEHNGVLSGGLVVGKLIAASPVQVFIGTFPPLAVTPTLEVNNVLGSLIATPTMPFASGFSFTGAVHQPDMMFSSFVNLNREWNGSGSGVNP